MVLFFALSLWSFFRSGSLGGERNIFRLFSRRSRGEEGIRGGRDEFVSYLFLLGDENNDDDKRRARAVPSLSADPAGRCSGDFCPSCNSGGSLPPGAARPQPQFAAGAPGSGLSSGCAAGRARDRGWQAAGPPGSRGSAPNTEGRDPRVLPCRPRGLQGHGAAEPLL